jgi:hypothetical protein
MKFIDKKVPGPADDIANDGGNFREVGEESDDESVASTEFGEEDTQQLNDADERLEKEMLLRVTNSLSHSPTVFERARPSVGSVGTPSTVFSPLGQGFTPSLGAARNGSNANSNSNARSHSNAHQENDEARFPVAHNVLAPAATNAGIRANGDATVTMTANEKRELVGSDAVHAYARRGECGLNIHHRDAIGRYEDADWVDQYVDLCYYEFVALINFNKKRTVPKKKQPKKKKQERDTGVEVDEALLAEPATDDVELIDDDESEESIDDAPAQNEDNAAAQNQDGPELACRPTELLYLEGYPARHTHVQAVLSRFRIPRFAGRVAGKVSTRTSQSQLDTMARYLASMFCPWSISQRPCVRDWNSFVGWFHSLDSKLPRHAGIKATITSMLTYQSSRFTRLLLSSFRMKYAESKYKRAVNMRDVEAAQPPNNEEAVSAELATIAANGPRPLTDEQDDIVLKYVSAIRSADRDEETGELIQYELRATRVPQQAVGVDAAIQTHPGIERMAQKFDELKSATDREGEFDRCYAMRNDDDIAEGNEGTRLRQRAATNDETARQAAAAIDANLRKLEKAVEDGEKLLNNKQHQVYETIKSKLRERVTKTSENGQVSDGGPCHLLHIQGGPGTGKSFLIQVLKQWAHLRSGNRPLIMAYTGYAASHIGGVTTHRGFRMHQHLDNMDETARAALRSRIANAPFVLIDEVSMIGCEFFAKIIHRIEDVLRDPWSAQANGPKFMERGFPPIILVGDFAQLNPVCDIPLYSVLTAEQNKQIEALKKQREEQRIQQREQQEQRRPRQQEAVVGQNGAAPAPRPKQANAAQAQKPIVRFDKWALQTLGAYYFKQFSTAVLDEQVRAQGCRVQAEMIDHMVRNGTVPRDLTTGEKIQYLNAAEPQIIKNFRFAPVITARNARRRKINIHQAVAFARDRNVPVLIWRKTLPEASITASVLEQINDITSPYWEYFVEDAPAMLLVNVVPHLSVSNGTSAKMHSLTWANADVAARNIRDIRCAKPGQIIQVDPPEYVNVEIRSTHTLPLKSLDQNAYLLPMRWWSIQAKYKTGALEMPAHDSHAVDLGFAFTFYKVQGATMENVILDLNFQRRNECTFSAVYVGLSRVRSVNNLRLLPITLAKVGTWLNELKWADELLIWMQTAKIARVPPPPQAQRQNEEQQQQQQQRRQQRPQPKGKLVRT